MFYWSLGCSNCCNVPSTWKANLIGAIVLKMQKSILQRFSSASLTSFMLMLNFYWLLCFNRVDGFADVSVRKYSISCIHQSQSSSIPVLSMHNGNSMAAAGAESFDHVIMRVRRYSNVQLMRWREGRPFRWPNHDHTEMDAYLWGSPSALPLPDSTSSSVRN